MICRRGVRLPAPTHRPRLKNAAHAKASGRGRGIFKGQQLTCGNQAALAP